jgi:hypothetical protein
MRLVTRPSTLTWLLERYLKAAERFYLNLVLNWQYNTNLFFGAR